MDSYVGALLFHWGGQISRGYAILLVKIGEEPQEYQWYMNFYILNDSPYMIKSSDNPPWGKQT